MDFLFFYLQTVDERENLCTFKRQYTICVTAYISVYLSVSVYHYLLLCTHKSCWVIGVGSYHVYTGATDYILPFLIEAFTEKIKSGKKIGRLQTIPPERVSGPSPPI